MLRDSLLFLFDRARVQEETSVIIQPEKDRTESDVSNINHVTKLMRANVSLSLHVHVYIRSLKQIL